MKKQDRKIIHKAIDGEATKEETRILQRNMESDPDIRRTYEQLKALEEGTKKVGEAIQPPQDFSKKVIGKIRDTERRVRKP